MTCCYTERFPAANRRTVSESARDPLGSIIRPRPQRSKSTAGLDDARCEIEGEGLREESGQGLLGRLLQNQHVAGPDQNSLPRVTHRAIEIDANRDVPPIGSASQDSQQSGRGVADAALDKR